MKTLEMMIQTLCQAGRCPEETIRSSVKETGKPVDELSLQAYAQLRAELYGGNASGTTPSSEAGPKAD